MDLEAVCMYQPNREVIYGVVEKFKILILSILLSKQLVKAPKTNRKERFFGDLTALSVWCFSFGNHLFSNFSTTP